MNRLTTLVLLSTLPGCSSLLGQPDTRPVCYQVPAEPRRCFASESELGEDVARRERMAVERAAEAAARQRALADAAAHDAAAAAKNATSAVERADRIQDDAFEILVEMQLDARERAASAPSSD